MCDGEALQLDYNDYNHHFQQQLVLAGYGLLQGNSKGFFSAIRILPN